MKLPRQPRPRFSVVVVDDVREVRRSLRRMFDRDSRFEVVAEADGGMLGIILAAREKPDLLILDLAMSDTDGMDALPAIRLVAPRSKVVVFSTSVGLGDNEERAILCGADAAFDKTINTKTLLRRLIRLMEADPRPTLEGAQA